MGRIPQVDTANRKQDCNKREDHSSAQRLSFRGQLRWSRNVSECEVNGDRQQQKGRDAISDGLNQPEIVNARAHPGWPGPVIHADTQERVPRDLRGAVDPNVDAVVGTAGIEG